MKIKSIELFHLRMPLKFIFKTAKASIAYRETIVLKLRDEMNNQGYGEVVAFNDPFYTEETLSQGKKVLIHHYIPSLIDRELDHPFAIHKLFDLSFPMTVAGIENACLDLYSRRLGQPIMKVVFNEPTRKSIYAGVGLGDLECSTLIEQIAALLKEGYIRFKIKIKPEDGYEKLKEVRKAFPDILLMADANMSFTEDQMEELMKFDRLNLLCLEEPLAHKDFFQYSQIQAKMNTPICLDESIQTVEDLKKAIELKAFHVLNLKIGRIGGMFYAKQMIELCRKHRIKYWIGSMVESGISKILHVHLASLTDGTIPGDLSSSRRYFPYDVIKPEITVSAGKIEVPQGRGLGIEVDEEALKGYAIDYCKWGGD